MADERKVPEFVPERYLPKFLLEDSNGYAIAMAVKAMLDYFAQRYVSGLKLLHEIDEMPEWRLDEYAWEKGVFWYDADADIEGKRQQLKNAKEFAQKLGTPYAVIQALEAVYGAGWLEEWFEYGGEPYHFAIYTTNQSALVENRAKFMKLLGMVKNVRSVLDNIYYCGESAEATVYAGTKVVSLVGSVHAVAK